MKYPKPVATSTVKYFDEVTGTGIVNPRLCDPIITFVRDVALFKTFSSVELNCFPPALVLKAMVSS